jgi:acyl-CoA dehydrogenase
LVAYEAAWRYDNEPAARTKSAALSTLIGADMVFCIAVSVLDGTSEMMRRIVARHVFREGDQRTA